MSTKRGMGWLHDLPDVRDYTTRHPIIAPALVKSGVLASAIEPAAATVPASIDLRNYASPIEDQGELGSCTAHAAAGIIELMERRVHGSHIDASRLFIYKATRNLMGVTGDSGAYLRQTMGAIALFGACPERFWPYQPADFDKEPTAFHYGFADHYSALLYHRLDPPNATRPQILAAVKTHLAAKLPAMFGFTVYDNIADADATGRIPFPGARSRVDGGHAVAAVGYADNMDIAGERGALLVRNSWGAGWGEEGYGWLPYAYVLQGLADDWWVASKLAWLNTGAFDLKAA